MSAMKKTYWYVVNTLLKSAPDWSMNNFLFVLLTMTRLDLRLTCFRSASKYTCLISVFNKPLIDSKTGKTSDHYNHSEYNSESNHNPNLALHSEWFTAGNHNAVNTSTASSVIIQLSYFPENINLRYILLAPIPTTMPHMLSLWRIDQKRWRSQAVPDRKYITFLHPQDFEFLLDRGVSLHVIDDY